MELELLEQLADNRHDLNFALMIYRGDFAHLQATLLWQASDGLIEVWKQGAAQPVSVSELKAAFADATLWRDAQRMKDWALTLTDKGADVAFS